MANIDPNTAFLLNTQRKNWDMPNVNFTSPGQVLDIELDSLPGWLESIDLSCFVDVNVAATALPSLSPFAPYNIFRYVEVSLGGGPFQRVHPYFYLLREMAMNPGWVPNFGGQTGPSGVANTYPASVAWNIPAIAAGDNYWQFTMRIPLQAKPSSVIGHIPLGSASVKAKIRLTLTTQLYGNDQYTSPLYGGTGVTATIGNAKASYVQPNLNYRTTPAVKADIPNPQIGAVLNVQERIASFVGAGSLTPIKYPDPYTYLRLWHIVVDGTGAPNSSAVTNFELDLTPGLPQFNYKTPGSMQNYFSKIRRLYQGDLPTGVFCFDLWNEGGTGNPRNPDGTQVIDGRIFQTLQTQLAVSAATNVGSPAKIITFAEALSPVGF
jgi:hypothetical protein